MRKTALFLTLFSFCLLNSNAQFIDFHSSQKSTRQPTNSSVYTPSLDSYNSYETPEPAFETVRTTGYILTSEGKVSRKIQLRIQVYTNGNSFISAYYNVDPSSGGGNWIDIRPSIKTSKFASLLPISTLEKVAYANFTDCAFWDASGKIWFNL